MRHVRTEEGSRFFNMPIGSPITEHLISAITARNKVAGILPSTKGGSMLADDPLHVSEVSKASAAGSRTVSLGPNVPLDTHPAGDHENTLNRLMPGTHVYHVTGAGGYHEHVKNADGSWEEHMPGSGGSLGHSRSASELGKSISGADSATVTHVPSSEPSGPRKDTKVLAAQANALQTKTLIDRKAAEQKSVDDYATWAKAVQQKQRDDYYKRHPAAPGAAAATPSNSKSSAPVETPRSYYNGKPVPNKYTATPEQQAKNRAVREAFNKKQDAQFGDKLPTKDNPAPSPSTPARGSAEKPQDVKAFAAQANALQTKTLIDRKAAEQKSVDDYASWAKKVQQKQRDDYYKRHPAAAAGSAAAGSGSDLEKESAKLRDYYKTAKYPLGSSAQITPPGNGDAAAKIVHSSADGTKFKINGLGTFTKGTDGKRSNGKSNVTYKGEDGRDFGFESMDWHARHGHVSKVEGQVNDSKGNSVSVQDKANEKALLQPAPKESTPKAPARVPVPLSFRPGKPITADAITGAKDGDVVHAVSPYGGTQRYVYSAQANGWHTPDNPRFNYKQAGFVEEAKAGKLFDGDPDARAQRLLPEELDAAKHGDQVSVDDRYSDRKNYTFNANKKQWEGPRGEVMSHEEMKAAANRWYVHQGESK